MEIIIDQNTELINHVNKIKDMQAEKNNEQTNKRKQMISLSFYPSH
jgi:2-iminoacetate synthase ThiH